MHYMSPQVDFGEIIAQTRVEANPDDTAHTLYLRALEAEFDLFTTTWPALRAGKTTSTPQDPTVGSVHLRRDLDDRVRHLDLETPCSPRDLLIKLRALTTNQLSEAAWFEERGRRYTVRVQVQPID